MLGSGHNNYSAMDPNDNSGIGNEDILFMNSEDLLLFGGYGENGFQDVLDSPGDNIEDHMATGNIPSREDYEGHYQFSINYDSLTAGQSNWVYSPTLNQVFIDINKVLLVAFKTSPGFPFDGFFIRALPVYSSSDYVNEPVNRCTIHFAEDDPQRRAHVEPLKCLCSEYRNVGHVVRAQCPDARYCFDPISERHSVLVKVTRPHPGCNIISIPYSFACKTSCPRGMQRRPIQVVFTLETINGVVGRTVLAVKICSCPKRDKDRQEKDYCNDKESRKRRMSPPPMDLPKIVKQETTEEPESPVGNENVDISAIRRVLREEMNLIREEMNRKYSKLEKKLEEILERL